jgi:hypothetical protein
MNTTSSLTPDQFEARYNEIGILANEQAIIRDNINTLLNVYRTTVSNDISVIADQKLKEFVSALKIA